MQTLPLRERGELVVILHLCNLYYKVTQTCTNYNYTSNRWKYQKEIFVFFNWKNARWLNNFDLIWNKMLFTDLGSPFDDTHMCIYAHVFSKGFCICLKLFPLINFWIFEKLCCCYFRAEIMKQMKNPRKWMRKTSFQLNSEWVCTHVYFIIIRRNEQAHAQTLLFLQHQRFLFVSYTEVCGFISLDMFIHERLKCV